MWPDMQTSFALFLEASWNWVGFGMGGLIRTHIIRSELEASARLLRVEMTPAIFLDIRIMEEAAMKYWGRKHG